MLCLKKFGVLTIVASGLLAEPVLLARGPAAEVIYTSECSCDNDHGVARWRAKTDPSEPSRNPADIRAITPSEIFDWTGPGTIPHGGGRTGNELRFFALTGRVIAVQAENDGDVHMVLANADDERPGKVIAEIPLGARWCGPRTIAFSWTNALFPFTANFKFNPFRLLQKHVVTVVGKAFYDTDHSGQNRRVNRRPRDKDKAVWEIHPVMQMQVVDPVAAAVINPPETIPSTTTAPPPRADREEIVTIVRAVTIQIPYGTTVIPAGMKLPVVSRDATTVRVRYLGELQTIPLTSTHLR